MNGGRRQHDAQPRQFRRHSGQFRSALGTEHDGRGRTVEQRAFALANPGMPGQRQGIEPHHRKGFFLALLAFAQFGHSGGIAGIAGEMEAAEPLDGNDFTGPQQAHGLRQRIAGQILPRGVEQLELRPALRTTSRFGMEAPIRRLGVFSGTWRA